MTRLGYDRYVAGGGTGVPSSPPSSPGSPRTVSRPSIQPSSRPHRRPAKRRMPRRTNGESWRGAPPTWLTDTASPWKWELVRRPSAQRWSTPRRDLLRGWPRRSWLPPAGRVRLAPSAPPSCSTTSASTGSPESARRPPAGTGRHGVPFLRPRSRNGPRRSWYPRSARCSPTTPGQQLDAGPRDAFATYARGGSWSVRPLPGLGRARAVRRRAASRFPRSALMPGAGIEKALVSVRWWVGRPLVVVSVNIGMATTTRRWPHSVRGREDHLRPSRRFDRVESLLVLHCPALRSPTATASRYTRSESRQAAWARGVVVRLGLEQRVERLAAPQCQRPRGPTRRGRGSG